MVNLIANSKFQYAKKMLKAEDLFSASERDARILVALGRARTAEVQKRKYKRRDMVAE